MAPPPSSSGRRSFRFRRRIGQGAFGEVYLAELVTGGGFSKVVAVKLLKPEFSDEREIVGRMRDEARLLGHLHHPAIIQADDLVMLGGRVAIVMEYVPGANLLSLIMPRINPDPIPPAALVAIIGRVAEALEAAWSRPSTLTGQPLRVLHRDIKPSNIRITPDGEVKVLDFGVARADAMERETTTHNQLVGSLTFLAPEVFLCHPVLPATDVYALGVSFFESLARSRFGRCGLTPEKQHEQVARRVGELDLSTWGECANPMRALLSDMLAFEPVRRPTAAHVARTCLQACRQLPGPELKAWAHETVERVAAAEQIDPNGELVGATLDEDSSHDAGTSTWAADPDDVTEPGGLPVPAQRRWLLLVVLLLLVVIPALAALGAGIAWLVDHRREATSPGEVPVGQDVGSVRPAPPVVAPAPVVAPEPEPAPQPEALPEPVPAPPPVAAPVVTEQPAPVAKEKPAPAPVVKEKPAPAPAPTAAPGTAQAGSTQPAALTVDGPRRALRNSPMGVIVRLDAPECRPVIHWKVEGQPDWHVKPLQGAGPVWTWSVEVTGEHRPALLYYVTAEPCGAGEGSAAAPLRVVVL
ncbi:MAG: serine/threonine-protein kinase [Pseudomonadota bacterium]